MTELASNKIQEGSLIRDPKILRVGEAVTCLIAPACIHGATLIVVTPPDETGYFYARRPGHDDSWQLHVDQYEIGVWK